MPPAKTTKPRSANAAVKDKPRRIKALIFGPPGHGKTYFIGTAVFDKRTTPIAILDFEGGTEDVLDGLPGQGTDWVSYKIQTWDDFNEVYNEILVPNERGFKAVAIDSLSEAYIFAFMQLLDAEKVKREDKDINPDMIQQGDYGVVLTQMRRLTRKFKDLPMHVFYTAHHRDDTDPKLGLIKLPNFPGKGAIELPGMMTVCGYLALGLNEDGETQRVLLLQNYAKIAAKVRTKWGLKVPDEIEDPTITDLLDVLQFDE